MNFPYPSRKKQIIFCFTIYIEYKQFAKQNELQAQLAMNEKKIAYFRKKNYYYQIIAKITIA
ncbi:hypothetical protein BZG02_01050 [Labilibaculum filiforme]|uniref:Uncharacterized protein n=1 Tax=Labilibaculum filiforme TaxID=1940526 RepID=A0A2N3I5N9_9BACT|nr:hypothetical protein BZG02_01050 [Labilibaculum filiforme]